MNQSKIYLFFIPIVILGLFLINYAVTNGAKDAAVVNSGLSPTSVEIEKQVEVPGEEGVGATTDQASAPDEGVAIEQVAQVLDVNESRCRGCGRCAMIDPEHFKISGRVATVISQGNLDSSTLTSAIGACPENAISLS